MHRQHTTFNHALTSALSSEDALHFYQYLCTHILIADEQFLLLTDVPIQDHTQQLEIYEVFDLVIPHRNFSAHYSINNRYLGIMHDETKAVKISEDQFKTCQKANRQFCSLNTPLLPLTNPPTCISASYTKDKASIKKRCSLQIRKASSVSIPTSITPNVWVITSPPTAVSSGIILLCNSKFVSKNNWYFDLSSTYFLYPLASLPKMVKLEIPASIEQS